MRRLDNYQIESNSTIRVEKNSTITQSFQSHKGNLAGVRLIGFNPNLGGSENFELTSRDENNQPVRTLSLSETNLGWGSTIRFDFAPIPDSRGKTYVISVSAPESTTAQLDLAYTSENKYAEGAAQKNNEVLSGDLVFETYYQTSGATIIIDPLINAGIRFTQDPVFLFFYCISLAGLIAFIIKRGRSIKKK